MGCSDFVARHVRRCPRMFLLTGADALDILGARARESIAQTTTHVIPRLFPGIKRLEVVDVDVAAAAAAAAVAVRRNQLSLVRSGGS